MIPIRADDEGKRIQAVQRAFAVIEVLRGEGSQRIADVAEALDIPMSTAHVHLKTLESVGYVVRDDDGYRLGLRFLRDGITVRGSRRVYRVCRSELDELAAATGEVANVGVEERGLRIILDQAEGTEAVYDNAPIGEYAHMHCTALGKALLAERSEEYVSRVIECHGLPDRAANTVTDAGDLRAELRTVEDRGYAVEDEERRAGIRSVASPLIVEGTLVGALSLSGPKERFGDQRLEEEILPQIRNTKNVIEVKYAYE